MEYGGDEYYGEDIYIPSPIEKIEDSQYPYPVNAGIPRQNGTGSDNTHGDVFICHLY